jgi:hypothetical protein
VVQPATYDTLRRWQTKVDVFCYIGHGGVGKGRGGFFFEDEAGQSDFVAAEDVADLLNRLRVSFAVLYSCYGGTVGGQSIFLGVAPAMVRAGVPGAVAMQGEISIKPSLAFLEAIFRAISQPRPITEAVAQAREALFRSEEWFRPALYLRSADDDARLFLPAPPVDLVTPVAPPPPLSPTDVPPQRLMDVMSRAFQSNGEFDRLLWEIDIRLSRHQLAGETLGEKLIALYRWCDERQRYADLVEAVIRLRPAYRDEILAPV